MPYGYPRLLTHIHCYDKFSLKSVQVYFTNVPTYSTINTNPPRKERK